MSIPTKEDFTYSEDEKTTSKLSRKARESPFVIVGIGGLLGSCAYAAYRWRTKGPTVSTSAFLMQLRVAAQSTFLGCVLVGLAAQVLKDQLFPSNEEPSRYDTRR